MISLENRVRSGREPKKQATAHEPRGSGEFSIRRLGASAGGLSALQVFFDHVPKTAAWPLWWLYILSPATSYLAELLQPRTGIPVLQVTRPSP